MCEMSKSLECEANGGDDKWVADSSLDYKGRLPLRDSTGAWKASLFIIDKAAVYEDKEGSAEKQSPWRLATVTKVEEMKLILNMIPIWLATLPFGVTIAQTSTFFIKQAANLNRKMGDGLILPPTTIFCLTAIGMIVSLTIYDKLLVPMLRRATGNER
ncbi:Protein NRT1/ PTR FAMILY 5.7, partial [Cucurbita argyrosperma subsp. argyrosperma]